MSTDAPATLDTNAPLERLKGDAAFLKTLFEVFLTDLPRKLETLEPAVQEQDLDAVLRTAHALKGACATIGALALRDAAERLELAARAGDAQAAGAAHAPVADLAERLRERLLRELD